MHVIFVAQGAVTSEEHVHMYRSGENSDFSARSAETLAVLC